MWAQFGVNVYGANEGHVVLQSRTHRPNATVPGVVWCHGHTSATYPSTTVQTQGPDAGTIPYALAEKWPLISADLGGNVWGNDTAIARVGLSKTYLQGTAAYQPQAKAGGVFLVGGSMGAAAALNWARQNLSSVKAIALLIPAVDVDDIHDNNRNGYAAEIETAYTNLAGWDAAVSTHNPVTYAAELTGIPIKVWYSSSDPICVPATASAFATASGATLRSLGAVGHTSATVDASEITDFFQAYA